MTLIIFCHPSKNSHNAKILAEVESILKKKKAHYELLDLYEMDFNACLSEAEYDRMKNRDHTIEPDVLECQEKITAAKTLIFIYPTWWYNMPAKLKGFMDRVFTSGFAYKFFKVPAPLMCCAAILSYIPGIRYLMQTKSVNGLLKGKRALIFRTYGGPAAGKRIFGNTPAVLENVILRFCGITDITIHELFNVDKSSYTQEYEDGYLKGIVKIL
jgi:NAD(P)H dehydrogenase (quinone)